MRFEELDKLLSEEFKSIKYIKREFYPRNFELSKEFVLAFKKEHARLIKAGMNPKAAFKKLCKALLFYTV